MGIQCSFSLTQALPKLHQYTVDIEVYPADEYSPELIALSYRLTFPCGATIWANGSVGSDCLWFDCNHWSDNRHQLDVLRENGITFTEA